MEFYDRHQMDAFGLDVDHMPPKLMVKCNRRVNPWRELSGVGRGGGIVTIN